MTSGAKYSELNEGQYLGLCKFLANITAIDHRGISKFESLLLKDQSRFKLPHVSHTIRTNSAYIVIRSEEGQNTASVTIKRLKVPGKFLNDPKNRDMRRDFKDYLSLLEKVAHGNNTTHITDDGLRVATETPYHRAVRPLGAFVREIPDMKPVKIGPEVSASEFLKAKARESDLLEHTLNDQTWEPTFQNKMLIYEHLFSPLTASP
jgi:hypothetical protein